MKQVGEKQCFEAREINGFERILTWAHATAQENPQLVAWRLW